MPNSLSGDRIDRRDVLKQAAAVAACSALTLPQSLLAAAQAADIPVATQQYPWGTFYRRSGKKLGDLELLLGEVKSCGLTGYEPIASSRRQIENLAKVAAKHQLSVDSIYVNSTLHDADQIAKSMESVLQIAAASKEHCGTKIVVTNPTPVRWGGQEDKSDEQLRRQADALNQLGAKLRKQGQQLAYHNHDAELRQGARELHHMLASTDPENVKFCLDAHWVFRGCGNSEVAVMDVARLYRSRVVELHLRQSTDGVWDEAFGPGDIDYNKLVQLLADLEVPPLLVLEQAVEGKSPKTMTSVEAHTAGRKYAQDVFEKLSRA